MDNGPIAARGNARLLNRHSAAFYEELGALAPGLVLAQALVDFGETLTLGDFDLSGSPHLTLDALPWPAKGRLGRAFAYLRALPWIFSLTRRSDHLYLFLPGHLPLLFAWAARRLGRPYGVYLRGELHLDTQRMQSALAGARFAFATTSVLCERARRWCPDVELVSPMIELTLGDVAERREVRHAPPFRLLFVGRVEEPKGVGELLEAIGKLQAHGIDLRLELVGGGPELTDFRDRARRLGLAHVHFAGVVSDRVELARLFREADLFVLPTHSEGFPRVLFEAMTYGTPILTTFVGGIPSLMIHGENCLRIEPRDAAGLAAGIESALADPARRLALSAGGTRTIRRVLGGPRKSHAQQVAERLER